MIKQLTIAQMKAIAKKSGYSWFDSATMKYHGTKILTKPNKDNVFIISNTESFSDGSEKVKILVCQWNSETEKVNTLNDYNHFETLEDAKQFVTDYYGN